jgi:PAS domain S-box-containing protein
VASRLTSVLADPDRLAAVRQTNLLDTPAEDAFDRVARLAARLLEVPIALLPLIEDDRQFFKACVGLPEPWASARQTSLSHSLCQHVVVARRPLAIDDTARDGLARDNPLVRELGLAAYLGVPLIDPSGYVLGSVCVADHRPRDWTPEQVAVLTDLAGLVMTQIQLRAELVTRGELERRLVEVEASLQALLERLPGVVYALSPEAPNSVLYVSPQIQTLVGVPVADCIGDPELWDRLVHPEDLERVAAACERTNQTGEPFSDDYRMCTADGRVRWVHDEAVLVRAGDGRPLFWQGILTNITASHLTAERLAEALDREQEAAQQLTAALERERAAAEHLRAVDEMKTTFLQAVSHDLRTPLTTILGIALTLEHRGAGLPAGDLTDLLARLSGNARKLDRLLGDLLDLDRLARGTLTPRRQLIDLSALIHRVVEDAVVRDEHPVMVDAPPLRLAADGPKLERIIENLLLNAAKHTPAGTTIWVRLEAQDDGVLLMVEDEGPGIPAQLREQVFQPFHQGRNVADHAPGSGIGLALVAQFASLHGGRAWVQDRFGGGASFRVSLPDSQIPEASSR